MLKKIIIVVVTVLIAVASWLMGFTQKPLGSVESSAGAYYSTTTVSTSLGTAGYIACTGRCVLGSIVVNQLATTGYVRVWNATSTATSTYATTNIASSTGYLATTFGAPLVHILSASDVAGTYTYDINSEVGIVVETADDFNGEYTVTWKR